MPYHVWQHGALCPSPALQMLRYCGGGCSCQAKHAHYRLHSLRLLREHQVSASQRSLCRRKPKGDGGKGTGKKMSRQFATRHTVLSCQTDCQLRAVEPVIMHAAASRMASPCRVHTENRPGRPFQCTGQLAQLPRGVTGHTVSA